MAYTPGINSLLERLLPKGWQSQVSSTFGPKRFNRIAESDWGGGGGWQIPYQEYQDMLDAGLVPTQNGYDFFTKGETPYASFATSADRIKELGGTDFWYDPSQMDDINVFDPNSLVAGFKRAGLQDANKSMATPFQASDLRALDPSSYTSQMEKDRSNLATSLQNKLASSAGMGGGFAGYGGRTEAQDLATQQFKSGAEGLYADANKQRASAVGKLYSKLEDYDKLIAQAT